MSSFFRAQCKGIVLGKRIFRDGTYGYPNQRQCKKKALPNLDYCSVHRCKKTVDFLTDRLKKGAISTKDVSDSLQDTGCEVEKLPGCYTQGASDCGHWCFRNGAEILLQRRFTKKEQKDYHSWPCVQTGENNLKVAFDNFPLASLFNFQVHPSQTGKRRSYRHTKEEEPPIRLFVHEIEPLLKVGHNVLIFNLQGMTWATQELSDLKEKKRTSREEERMRELLKNKKDLSTLKRKKKKTSVEEERMRELQEIEERRKNLYVHGTHGHYVCCFDQDAEYFYCQDSNPHTGMIRKTVERGLDRWVNPFMKNCSYRLPKALVREYESELRKIERNMEEVMRFKREGKLFIDQVGVLWRK